MLTVLRALNAGNIDTKGDIWFVGFTGEEVGGEDTGAEQFVRTNYLHNIDWCGDMLAQFHGSGGEGISTGCGPYVNYSQLRVFVPIGPNPRHRVAIVSAEEELPPRCNREC